ncbi:MAG TPA: hypothetical protein VKQ72_04600, partial [Aggregatilineales bacterium]|nr:hypothetical protein [Aggregatilineales bacterium]
MPLYEAENENLRRILSKFQHTNSYVEGSMLLSTDGIPVVANFPESFDDDQITRLAAFVAAGVALGTALTYAELQSAPQMLSFTYEGSSLIVVPLY